MSEIATNVEQLQSRLGAKWFHLLSARDLARQKRAELHMALQGMDSEDTSIVVSGSLARDEFTKGSDVDWTLLIDGHADPRHYDLALAINRIVTDVAAKPTGAEGAFSSMVFSHNLIHEIGGEDDTNRNTTRRLLLLLESSVVGRDNAYRRVVNNILSRYLFEDRGFWRSEHYRVPRFLQNDFAKYWRTMAVDFAYKLRKRSGQGWAIRNIKLRMSRKLIYVSGLLACYRCHLDHSPEEWRAIVESSDHQSQMVSYFGGVFRATPLEILAGVLLKYDHLDGVAGRIFDAYDEFLGILADDHQRHRLESVTEEDAEDDAVYRRARDLSRVFRESLLAFFFDPKSDMDNLTKNYGVF